MRKTHTFIGMTSGKEAFRLVQCLYTLPGSLCTGVQSVYTCTARGDTRVRAVTDGMSHWRLLGYQHPVSLQTDTSCSFRSVICDHSDAAISGHRVLVIVTMMASDAILNDAWWKGKFLSVVTNISSVIQWMTQINDEQIIYWFRSRPGLAAWATWVWSQADIIRPLLQVLLWQDVI